MNQNIHSAIPAPSVSAAPTRLTLRGMVTQTVAMLVDAYRDLNSKKLFWITLGLSGFVVAVFGGVGFDEESCSIFGIQFKNGIFNTKVLPIGQLYKNLFLSLGVSWWLGFIALILALISTAPMFPDFLSGGAIDLFLARPLGRFRLFLTKYLVGLLFVALQVTLFCVVSFLVIGIRAGAWVPGVFLAVPVVVLTFSYLWSICALLGTLTRSTIASLLLTILAWLVVFGVQSAESKLLTFSVGSKFEAQALDQDVVRLEENVAALESRLAQTTQPTAGDQTRLKNLNSNLERTRAKRAEATDPFATWHRGFYAAYWGLPKTAETKALMERWLDNQFRPERHGPRRMDREDEVPSRSYYGDPRVQADTDKEVDRILRERSATWVIGTSLLFEGAMIGLAVWVFARRDF